MAEFASRGVAGAALGIGIGGLYDVDALFTALDETFRQYREFPVPLPTIPFLSRNENSFTFRAEDLEEIKRRISAACGYGA